VDDGQNGVRVRIVVGAATDVGGRSGNEDAVHVSELPPLATGPASGDTGLLLMIADGMGGHQRGEIASQMAIETVRGVVAGDPGADTGLLLKQAFRRANEAIHEDSRADGDEQTMGTTLVAIVTRGKYASIASIGDSRAYLVRANRLNQITKDHSYVAEQVSQGTMTAIEARESPHRNVLTHALGHRPTLDRRTPDVFELDLLPEDRLLLCTDGFYDVVSDDDMLTILLGHEPESAAKTLVNLAVERGTTDNVSAIVAQVLPTRIPVTRELVAAGGTNRFGAVLVPALVALAAIVFIAIVLFVLVFS
jgi:protein phosphatase